MRYRGGEENRTSYSEGEAVGLVPAEEDRSWYFEKKKLDRSWVYRYLVFSKLNFFTC